MPASSASGLPSLKAQAFGKRPTKDGTTPTLVLLGGFPDDSALWSRQIIEFESTHHIVSICTPHYDHVDPDGGYTNPLPSSHRWGYTPQEVRDMILACIDEALSIDDSGPSERESRPTFDLVTHDWGAYWGYLVASERPDQVRRMVALDIGANASSELGSKPGRDGAPRGALWQLPYQLWFALCFAVGAGFSPLLAQAMFRAFSFVEPLIGPLGYGYSGRADSPRPLGEQKWWMCWPYFQVWSCILRGKELSQPLSPSMPVLYVYGKKKRAMFQTDSFLRKLKATKGCKVIGYDCSHWVQHERASELNREMRSFLD